jgi:hypothetical protein
MRNSDDSIDRDLARALHDLAADTPVPPAEPAREAALMAAFDTANVRRRPGSRAPQYVYMAALAAAASVLIAVALYPALTGRHGPLRDDRPSHGPSSSRGVHPEPPSEFVMMPGAAALPPMESGSLVRLDVPVAMLPSLGVTPPPNRVASVQADFIVAQDGLPRAVRLVD